jgi:hypothetical protein
MRCVGKKIAKVIWASCCLFGITLSVEDFYHAFNRPEVSPFGAEGPVAGIWYYKTQELYLWFAVIWVCCYVCCSISFDISGGGLLDIVFSLYCISSLSTGIVYDPLLARISASVRDKKRLKRHGFGNLCRRKGGDSLK